MVLRVDLEKNGYDIILARGELKNAGKHFRLDRKVLIVTDDCVPKEYAEAVAAACSEPHIITVPSGEDSKSFEAFKMLLEKMLEYGFTRTDCAVAVGGGVVGDLTGFAAASFMRGIDFYNLPTTLLSQLDSSVGGKVAINLGGVKNIVGAFYQPKKVLIDPNVLSTLPKRQISSGLAEALKMGLTSNAELYKLFKEGRAMTQTDKVIELALGVKIGVVEADEKETGLRKILNFGHTLGHGIEGLKHNELYHGECVALGMIPMVADDMRDELVRILESIGLPTSVSLDLSAALEIATHDKKCDGSTVSAIFVPSAGSFEIKKLRISEWNDLIRSKFSEYVRE